MSRADVERRVAEIERTAERVGHDEFVEFHEKMMDLLKEDGGKLYEEWCAAVQAQRERFDGVALPTPEK